MINVVIHGRKVDLHIHEPGACLSVQPTVKAIQARSSRMGSSPAHRGKCAACNGTGVQYCNFSGMVGDLEAQDCTACGGTGKEAA